MLRSDWLREKFPPGLILAQREARGLGHVLPTRTSQCPGPPERGRLLTQFLGCEKQAFIFPAWENNPCVLYLTPRRGSRWSRSFCCPGSGLTCTMFLPSPPYITSPPFPRMEWICWRLKNKQ